MQETIFEAIILVVLVVVIFLQTWRAAVIPLVAIPVSLIGTFFVMAAAGFTINTLSLFGLVLAVGIVVDDAIVVVENVERNIAAGLRPREAAIKSMDEVGVALVAIALVLCAVFIPSAFITGISGQFYRQFALTIAAATVISLIISLTLVAGACARCCCGRTARRRSIGGRSRSTRFFGLFNKGFDWFAHGYGRVAGKVVRIATIMLVAYAAVLAFGLNEFRKTPVGFIPQVDGGYLVTVIQLPPAASLARTDAVNRRVVELALKTPGVVGAVNIVGFSGATFTNSPNAGAIFLVLAPFAERAEDPNQSALAIQRQLFGKFASIEDGAVFVVLPPPVRGVGNAGGFRMMIEDRAGQRSGGVAGGDLRDDGPCCADAGRATGVLAVRDIDAAALSRYRPHQGATARHQRAGRVFRVADLSRLRLRQRLQSVRPHVPRDRAGRRKLSQRIHATCSRFGSAIRRAKPCRSASFTTVRDISGPYRVPRYNLYPAAELDGNAAPGYSQGQAIEIMEKLAQQTLPEGFGYEWTTLAFQQLRAGNTAMFAFVLAVVFVFLVLAAQFESLTLPLAVILIVPMCLVASIIGVVIARAGQQYSDASRLRRADRLGREERHLDRGVRQADRGQRQGPLSRGGRGGAAAVPADLDDLVGLHFRRLAAGLGDRRRRRIAPDAWHRGVFRHDRGHRIRPDLHAGVLCGDALDRACISEHRRQNAQPAE